MLVATCYFWFLKIWWICITLLNLTTVWDTLSCKIFYKWIERSTNYIYMSWNGLCMLILSHYGADIIIGLITVVLSPAVCTRLCVLMHASLNNFSTLSTLCLKQIHVSLTHSYIQTCVPCQLVCQYLSKMYFD